MKQLVAAKDGGVLAAGKFGAYQFKDGAWTQLHDTDIHGISQGQDGTLYITTKTGALRRQGTEWIPWSSGFDKPVNP